MQVFDNEICYPEKYSMEICKLFKCRYNLHHDCYNHKAIHAYELMVCDVLFECNKILYDFEEVIWDPERYVMLDDSIIDEIVCSRDPRLKKAKEIIERMQYRKHYKCVGEKGLSRKVAEKRWDQITAQAIVQYQEDDLEPLSADDIVVKKFIINHGLKEAHPLENVKFFDKKSQS